MSEDRPIRAVALVGCGSKKRDLHDIEARRLYTSSYFKKKRQVAEELCDRWFILSAKHGLLDPTASVDSYDQPVRDFNARERTQWASDVVNELVDEISEGETLVFLAGRDYVEPITDRLLDHIDGSRCSDPFFQTGGIGEQLAWMNEALNAGDPFLPVGGDGVDPTDPDMYRLDDARTEYAPDGPDVNGWELECIVYDCPQWMAPNGDRVKVVKQSERYPLHACGEQIKHGSYEREDSIKKAVEWMRGNPAPEATPDDQSARTDDRGQTDFTAFTDGGQR